MNIVNLNRDQLTAEYGLHTQRLLPWPVLNPPFEGSWCVVAPGTASTAHSHHEHEIFIAVRGAAAVEVNGERAPFGTGDVAFFEPGQVHRVINDAEERFEFYSIWWDREMSDRVIAANSQDGSE
jgi:mannose-6-phosphate isomerase-like protein (cupin superfamily)